VETLPVEQPKVEPSNGKFMKFMMNCQNFMAQNPPKTEN